MSAVHESERYRATFSRRNHVALANRCSIADSLNNFNAPICLCLSLLSVCPSSCQPQRLSLPD